MSGRRCIRAAAAEVLACLSGLSIPEMPDNRLKMRRLVYRLSRLAEQRSRGAKIPSGSVDLLDAGRGLETLAARLRDPVYAGGRFAAMRSETARIVSACHKGRAMPAPEKSAFTGCGEIYSVLVFIRDKLGRSPSDTTPRRGKKERPRRSFSVSPLRLTYAVRVSLLLSLCIVPVQALGLPHGKWLIFTLASVSLPYAEDVAKKGFGRFAATLTGGAIGVVCFSLVENAGARTAIMMTAGYLSFYVGNYVGNYSCATVGALGGSVMSLYGWANVTAVFGIRAAYIALGILLAFAANLLIRPFSRGKASEDLFRKYAATAGLLSRPDATTDRRTYYALVVHNNLLEEKLLENAAKSGRAFLPHVRASRETIYKSLTRGAYPKDA